MSREEQDKLSDRAFVDAVDRGQDRRVEEHRGLPDLMGLLTQLGAVPQQPAAPVAAGVAS